MYRDILEKEKLNHHMMCPLYQRYFLSMIIREYPNVDFLEIGIYEGANLFYLYQVIDRMEGNYSGVDKYSGDTECINAKNKFLNIVEKYNIRAKNNVKFYHLKDGSDEYFRNLDINKKYDVIFIDGCHLYECVKKDLLNSIRHIKVGGKIILHDVYNKKLIHIADIYNSFDDKNFIKPPKEIAEKLQLGILERMT